MGAAEPLTAHHCEQPDPPWAVVLSVAITAAAVVVVANLAAKIFERSVLRTSRRVGWFEAFRARQEIEPAAPGFGSV